jgi:SAM-dependent methyltransferase
VADLEEKLELARKNRAGWDAASDEYQSEHSDELTGDKALAWGIWRLPESDLQVLGDVAGKDVLELGCGQAEWSLELARKGARSVGLDNSGGRLGYARAHQRREGVHFPLVQASAEIAPFRSESFDIVFCDYGAMTFLPPERSIPETARLLRPGGLLAFTTTHPLLWCSWPHGADEAVPELLRDYFSIYSEEEDGIVDFNLPLGEWVRLFVANGLAIEDLVEVRPPEGATTTYGGRPLSWARRWPAEMIWRVRKHG